MSTPPPPAPTIAGTVRTLQIIAISLFAGVLLFLIVTLVLRGSRGPLVDNALPLTNPMVLVGLAVGLGALVTSTVVPGAIASASRKRVSRSDPPEIRQGALIQGFASRTIVRLALIEGAAFLNLILFLSVGGWPCLVMSVVLLLALIPAIPTLSALESWLESPDFNE